MEGLTIQAQAPSASRGITLAWDCKSGIILLGSWPRRPDRQVLMDNWTPVEKTEILARKVTLK